MCKEYVYLKIGFSYYTEECEKNILGICEKMGMFINELSTPRSYVVISEDEKTIEYVKYLAECDMVVIIDDSEEE